MSKRYPKQRKSECGESGPNSTSKYTQDERFGQVLGVEAQAACSKRPPYGSFAEVSSSPHQKKVRDIGTGDRQDKDNTTQKREDGRS